MSDTSYETQPAPAEAKPLFPDSDQEFVFEGEAPDWIDAGCVGAEPDPDKPGETRKVIHVPYTEPGTQPYTTVTARPGDKIIYKANKKDPTKFGKVTVEPKEEEEPTEAPAA